MSRKEHITNNYKKWYHGCQQSLRDIFTEGIDFSKYNVDLKSSPGFKSDAWFKVKYNDLCKFNYDWQLACRGTMTQDKTFVFSLNKFFNAHEFTTHYGLTLEEVVVILKNQGYEFVFCPKWDGTNLQIFHDSKKLHIYTLGSLETDLPFQKGTNLTYSKLGEELLTPEQINSIKSQPPYHSVIFELCTVHNPIVCEYMYHDNIGSLKPLIEITPNGTPGWYQLKPEFIWPVDLNSKTLKEEKQKYFDHMVNNAEIFGKNPEGLILYAIKDSEAYPICKLKRPEYYNSDLKVGILPGSDADLCRLQLLVCQDRIDDIPLNKLQQNAVEEFQEYLKSITFTLVNNFSELQSFSNDKKQLATLMEKLDLPNWVRVALFRRLPDTVYGTHNYLINLLLNSGKNTPTQLQAYQKFGYRWYKQTN